MQPIPAILARVVLATMLAAPPLAAAGSGDDGDRLPLAAWTAAWWQRILSLPRNGHPLFDATGERCMIGQHGPVWFLDGTAGGSGPRACAVPEGALLLVPVHNRLAIGATLEADVAALRRRAGACVENVVAMHAALDGRPLGKLHGPVRVRSDVFSVTVLADGLIEPGGHGPLVDDGWYLVLRPLPVGRHVLALDVTTGGCEDQPPYRLTVDYLIEVRPAAIDERKRIPRLRREP